MKFVSLHHHSTYSYQDGYALPEQHVERAAELGMSAMALTEHGNVSSHIALRDAGNEHGVKPLYGVELYCGSEGVGPITAKNKLGLLQSKNHLTVLAENNVGYRNLNRLVSDTWANGFYYYPTATGKMLKEHQEGLIVLSGCTGSLLATSLRGGKWIPAEQASYQRAREVAARFRDMFGDAYYLEVQIFPELEATCEINPQYEKLSKELGIPLVATADVHYPRPEQSEMQRILHAAGRGGEQDWEYDIKLTLPTSDKAVVAALQRSGISRQSAREAVLNTAAIAERCTVTLPTMPMVRYPLPHGETSGQELYWKQLREGWRYRGFHKLPAKTRREWAERVKYESSIIEEKDYIDYFLIVGDLVRFAKDSGIPVGPARGSAAASLVCYLLRITEVNPMMFNSLVFERFIDKTRADLPDIDLDFDDERRDEIRLYAISKYGADRVGNIGTFTAYKSKNSLDDVARVYNIPQYEVDNVKELLLERSSGDLRASATIEDTVEQFDAAREVFERYPDLHRAMDLEGNYKGMGVHAAGLIISSEPITEVCAVYAREVAGVWREVVSYDKYSAERMGLLKIDVLGLSTMGQLRIALEMLDMDLQDMYDLPLDDPVTLQGFVDNDVVGVFQFDGRAMRSVNQEIQPDNFEEICAVNALARPGPLHNNATADYIDIKKGRAAPPTRHPILDDITKWTHGQIVYQEQILRIVMEIGNFTWTHAAYIRKIISRKLGEQEFNRQWDTFKEGAISNGFSEEEAKAVWGQMITAGSYAFNKAHCTAYGMLAYWCMWLKKHHPQVFYVSALRKHTDPEKQLALLRDTAKHGRDIDILPPHPVKSEASWTRDGTHIRGGFTQIKGVGDRTADAMLAYRDTHEVRSWEDYVHVKGIGPKTVQTMEEFSNKHDPFEVYLLRDKLQEVRELISRGKLHDARGRRLPQPTHTTLQVPYAKGKDTAVTWIGVMNHRNLRELFEVNFSRTGEALDPATVKDPHLNEWVMMRGEDHEDLLTFRIDRWKYPKFKKAIWDIKLGKDFVLVRGVKPGYMSWRMVNVSDMWVIEP